jgi:guanylate kinase
MSEALFIFIAPPSMEELEKRLRSRNTESEESIQKRLQTAKLELQSIRGYNSVIVNDCLEKAIHEVKDIINIYN